MKKMAAANSLVLLALASFTLAGCKDANDNERDVVMQQQEVYTKSHPVPYFEWSLQRQLWVDFYRAQNSSVSTWSFITANGSGMVISESIPTQGFPIPADTQLTNPLQTVRNGYGSVIEQPEPNGLFTSKNTDATILMALNNDGTVSPIYCEQKVVCFPYPVKVVNGVFVRIQEAEPTIKLKRQSAPPPGTPN